MEEAVCCLLFSMDQVFYFLPERECVYVPRVFVYYFVFCALVSSDRAYEPSD